MTEKQRQARVAALVEHWADIADYFHADGLDWASIIDATSDLATILKWCEANPEKYTVKVARMEEAQ